MSAFTALLLPVDGDMERIEWEVDEEHTVLSYLQATVGGDHKLVDCVSISASVDMWIGDESAVDGSEANARATYLGRLLELPGPYFGPVVFTGGPDIDGDTMPLREHEADLLQTALS